MMEESRFFTAFRISSLAESSISALAPSLNCSERAPDGAFYSLKRCIYSGSPHFCIAKLIANRRSGRFTVIVEISL